MAQIAYAEVPATAATAAAGAAPKQPSLFMNMVPLLFILGVFYFLLIRPQQKKMKEHKKLLEALKPGDLVVTNSGVYATVVSVGDRTMELKIADNVKIKILKSSVTEVLSRAEDSSAS